MGLLGLHFGKATGQAPSTHSKIFENANLFVLGVDCSFLTFETPHCLSWKENILVTFRDQIYYRTEYYEYKIVFRANRSELSTLDDYKKY